MKGVLIGSGIGFILPVVFLVIFGLTCSAEDCMGVFAFIFWIPVSTIIGMVLGIFFTLGKDGSKKA